MKRPCSSRGKFLAWLLLAGTLAGSATAQTFFDQSSLLRQTNDLRGVNWRWQEGTTGADIAISPGVPGGGLSPAATAGQFQGMVVYGGVTHPHTQPTPALLPGGFDANIANLGWPASITDGEVKTVLRATVAAPYLSRQSTVGFGEPIRPPLTDIDGNPLPDGVAPEQYWSAEPVWPDIRSADSDNDFKGEHTGARYYWSPHAGKVFAVNAGGVQVTWRRRESSGTSNPGRGMVLGGQYYQTNRVTLIVSGQPAKSTRRMYWTRGSYAGSGIPVRIPDGRIKAIKIAFSSAFPANVATNEVVEGNDINPQVPDHQKTLSFDHGFIHAYNREGRVFVELLGDPQEGTSGRRSHLGYEIVEVSREPFPDDEVPIELGERLTAFRDNVPSDADLSPEPLGQDKGGTFAFRHDVAGTGRTEYYAIKPTQNLNDLQVHWLEEGLVGVRWPYRFCRYRLDWPTSLARYSHYVRPVVADEAAAAATAVAVAGENLPVIAYQDPSDPLRAHLTGDLRFYTYLDPSFPRHRTLLRYIVGPNIAFERVFSVLDTEVKAPRFSTKTVEFDGAYLDLDPRKVEGPHAVVPDSVQLGDGSFTLETWVFVRGVRAWTRVFDFANGAGAQAIVFGLSESASGMPFLEIYSDDGWTRLSSSSPIPLNRWAHLAATFNSATLNGAIYLNGQVIASGPVIRPSAALRTSNFLGRSNWPGDDFPDARFADVRIWAVARTPAELAVGMNSHVPPDAPGLLAQYLFNGSEGGDGSGQGRDLTLVGAKVASPFRRPRFEETAAVVGQRLQPPSGENPSAEGLDYLAGYVQPTAGTPFSVTAYRNPFEVGFAAAAKGSIIPVNAPDNHGRMEVWWFRASAADTARGFKPTYWPSVISRYTLRWPTTNPETRDLVLASNQGSGPLGGREAQGQLYVQNERARPGYNPNEEHAILREGTLWALRDDLNIVSGPGYSSHPYALLEFTDQDGRPSMSTFRVLRESGAARFDYPVTAGTILRPPMPLPLLDRPMAVQRAGELPVSLNAEVGSRTNVSSAGTGLNQMLTLDQPPRFLPRAMLLLQGIRTSNPTTNHWFYPETLDVPANSLTGVVSPGEPASLSLNPAVGAPTVNPARRVRYAYTAKHALIEAAAPGTALKVLDLAGARAWEATRQGIGTVSGVLWVELEFATEDLARDAAGASGLLVPVTPAANFYQNWTLGYDRVPVAFTDLAERDRNGRYTFQDRKGDLWVYRGTHQDSDTGRMGVQFHYPTLPGFHFPSLPDQQQPIVGTLTPYLRLRNADGSYVGDPVQADMDGDRRGDGQALVIGYRPNWPAAAPVLFMGETLTAPRRGLPAIRGQTSAEVLYQQSRATQGPDARSVVLHDATRQKVAPLGVAGFSKFPASIRTSTLRGRTYFPDLPPHLVERVFFDPARGSRGALVLAGEFRDEVLGDDFLLPNVLGTRDAEVLKALCATGDAERAGWEAAISTLLVTTLETFVENPAKPGTYTPNAPENLVIGPGATAALNSSEQAKDSYALSAVGPGTGYVSLIAGNGRAFTPAEEPVSVQILRVSDVLYRGELKVVQSSNPLAEKLTVQQVTDLAGHPENFEFQWRMAAPSDGAPPAVYDSSPTTLLGDGPAIHVPHPLGTDAPSLVPTLAAERLETGVGASVVPVTSVPIAVGVALGNGTLIFTLPVGASHRLVVGNRVVARSKANVERHGTVTLATETDILVKHDGEPIAAGSEYVQLYEESVAGVPQSILFRSFSRATSDKYTQYYLSLDLDDAIGARVYVDGLPVVTVNRDGATDTSTAPVGFNPLSRVYRLGPEHFAGGSLRADGAVRTNVLVLELFSGAVPGAAVRCSVRLEAYRSDDLTVLSGTPWQLLDPSRSPDRVRVVLGESADVRALSDNYLISRYRAVAGNYPANSTNWSQWTEPVLAEGWIKRVLGGINPFRQRLTDLYNNQVNTDVSLVAQAGRRWEGDVALNLENINNYGLIEIYETVLRRGRMISIDAGINYGPANDALLLAAGYLNDLYLTLGNEALSDASNPTIGIGTKDKTYGDVATALFSFKGQVPSLLEEELALLRGRDDFLQPGVSLSPIYNRLVWNYTRGIDSGEVIYALNYNIQENNAAGINGVIDAADAAALYPQGHGDGYGHFLTALKGYYALLVDKDFDWVPRIEAVNILGKPVAVDYFDERKFAAAAAALANAGRQVFDLSWRRDFKPGMDVGWTHFGATRVNASRPLPTTRYWGVDHWANRTVIGAYVNWAMGNSIVPELDANPAHEGIQKIDRTTIPELRELATIADGVQTALDNAEAHLTPLGLANGSLAFDINPDRVTGAASETHFEQIYQRALVALNNAVAAFDDAKDVTRLLRSEQDSLADLRTSVGAQELAYTNLLINLYGTPYPEDIGPGRSYPTGYEGPDLAHFSYVDLPAIQGDRWAPDGEKTFKLNVQNAPPDWLGSLALTNFVEPDDGANFVPADPTEVPGEFTGHYLEFNYGPHGFFSKPKAWTGRRKSPGQIQQAISEVVQANEALFAVLDEEEGAKMDLDKQIQLFNDRLARLASIGSNEDKAVTLEKEILDRQTGLDIASKWLGWTAGVADDLAEVVREAIPESIIIGVAAGGDTLSVPRSVAYGALKTLKNGYVLVDTIASTAILTEIKNRQHDLLKYDLENTRTERDMETRAAVVNLGTALLGIQGMVADSNSRLHLLDDRKRQYAALVAQGERLRTEREIFRQRSAAIVQGFRTRDAAFRLFRTEKLERYKTLFDLAARYAYLAATAYDYETGLLNSQKGRDFVNRIVNARALGVVRGGLPQFAGSNTGDAGLSGALAEMKADWDVLRGRLGFNNPDSYGTTASLRTEGLRILPSADGDTNWKDTLQRARRANLLDDGDVRRHCLQIDSGDGLPVPGLVLEFSTTIADGLNLFGRSLAAGDHAFTPAAFATKIAALGVALEGYQGMDTPSATAGAIATAGAVTPADPGSWYLDGRALAANPYIYLIPVGSDSMRSPPLGDVSTVRTWDVNDVGIPMPFNIGGSEFSSKALYLTSDSLSEPLFTLRKHQAFRAVPTAGAFTDVIHGSGGALAPSQYTNRRLIGRSVWNSRWKLIIPGRTLLSSPAEGLDRFIETVRDVKLHFVTYSYSGN